MRTLPALLALFLAALPARAEPEPAWKVRRRAEDRIVRGVLELGRDDPAAAERAFAEATELDPSSGRASFLKGLALLRRERSLDALAALDAAVRLLSPDGTPPAALLLARAEALRALERVEEAEPIENEVGRPVPEDVEGCLWLGWLMLRTGVENLEAARGGLVRAIALHPRHDPFLARLTLSAALRRLGDLDGALEQAALAARHDRARAGAFHAVADLHRLRGDRAGEREALARALLLDPDDLDAAERLAVLDVADGDLNGAFDRLNALCARTDAPPGAWWLRCWVRLRFGEDAAARADLARALRDEPAAGIPGGVDPLDRSLRSELWAEADAASGRLAASEGQIPDLYLRLRGRAYLALGLSGKALADLEKAVEVAPGQAALLDAEILRARVEAEPAKARAALEERLRRALPDERVDLDRLVLRTLLVEGRWADAAPAAAALRGDIEARLRDLVRLGVEPGARRRLDLDRLAAESRLVEARGLLEAGDAARAERLVFEVIGGAGVEVRAEALALGAYLLARSGDRREEARGQLEAALARHESSRLRRRGSGHPLDGWTMRFAAETLRLLGDEEASTKLFGEAIREGLPTWAEEVN